MISDAPLKAVPENSGTSTSALPDQKAKEDGVLPAFQTLEELKVLAYEQSKQNVLHTQQIGAMAQHIAELEEKLKEKLIDDAISSDDNPK